jgi:hypothetical protein
MKYIAFIMLLVTTSCISVGVERSKTETITDQDIYFKLCEKYSDYLVVVLRECTHKEALCYKDQDARIKEIITFRDLCGSDKDK